MFKYDIKYPVSKEELWTMQTGVNHSTL